MYVLICVSFCSKHTHIYFYDKVDPFGHSWVTGGMWAQSGFDAFGVHRINYLDLQKRKNAQV